MIRGSTALVAILGSPIAQVKSPENFNAWFAQHDCDLVMLPIDLQREALPAFVDTLRGWNNLRGCVVTVPYKQAVFPLLDGLSPRAEALRSVNVIRRETDGRLIGDNVDGEGFVKAARAHGFDAAGKQALVVGSGGVGAAIAYALAEAGIAKLVITDVREGQAQALADVLAMDFPKLTLALAYGDLAAFDLVANATPVGMGDTGEMALPASLLDTLKPQALVADVVTQPVITPLLAYARERGCRVQAGPEMAKAQMGNLGAFMGVMPLDA
ncbi:MAG: shikimate dehydrogenase [Pseudomonas sp.]|uniref:shikimate dehydrogenase family protein n=1 Tax=Pseudomonas abieticivorans TaxID=2931382 RepID=UPI0020C15A55|nr:shikimate dehydrogenase [Pseudomonas sp. PIA16]MDE1168261.1 shikimate dehydrogenase [Pseudomonas sp.]